MDGFFTRELEINSKTLTFYQKEIGDVSCVVWDAALVLSKYLERRYNNNDKLCLKEKSILELGAGLGCVGLTAACLGAQVMMTDLPEVMPLLEMNIEMNRQVWSSCGGKAHSQVLQWGADVNDSFKTPDIILLADCVYYEESVEPLVKTFRAMASTSTEIIISQEERDTDKQRHVWQNFEQELLKYFEVTKIPEQQQHPDYCSPDIVVLHAIKKVADIPKM
ncbi:hypothetical protein L9F63_020580 [Diploptera punctata]|uniref:Protein-lysine methyltransferase METTL21D n=1 Tax=Diploptera punctata TaxID=6984 RepID=A0AAD8ECT2_DIPPU|nr:hypothetical protein L9F63_020580 [Diploptera punctata]